MPPLSNLVGDFWNNSTGLLMFRSQQKISSSSCLNVLLKPGSRPPNMKVCIHAVSSLYCTALHCPFLVLKHSQPSFRILMGAREEVVTVASSIVIIRFIFRLFDVGSYLSGTYNIDGFWLLVLWLYNVLLLWIFWFDALLCSCCIRFLE